MAPPKRTQKKIHQAAAELYAEEAVDTTVTLGQLIKLVAPRVFGPGSSSTATPEAEEAVKKAVHRAYPNPTDRVGQLWGGVVSRAELPTAHPDFVLVPAHVLVRLQGALRAGDPFFARFTTAMQAVDTRDAVADRLAALREAVDVLVKLDPRGEPLAEDRDRKQLSQRLSRLSSAWGSVFDAAVAELRLVPVEALAIAEQAIRRGDTAQRESRALQGAGGRFLRPGNGPWSIDRRDADPWVSAAAVVAVLTGTPAAELVAQTRSWVADNLDGEPERVLGGQVCAQAARALLGIGDFAAARQALGAAWASGDTNSTWEELLDLSITLAAVTYGHGDRAGAAAALPPRVREQLDGDYPGDPEEGWGASVDYRLYGMVRRALTDPVGAASDLKWAWVEGLGRGPGGRSPWVLAALLLQTLLHTGAVEEAAMLARLVPRVLKEPQEPVDRRLAGTIRGAAVADVPAVATGAAERLDQLLHELVPLVLRSPEALGYGQQHVLEGLASLAADARFGPRITARPPI